MLYGVERKCDYSNVCKLDERVSEGAPCYINVVSFDTDGAIFSMSVYSGSVGSFFSLFD